MQITRRRMLGENEEPPAEAEESSLPDVQNVDRQLGQLVRAVAMLTFAVAAWFIMADMFPAFQVLDRIEFWSTTQMVREQITAADGSVTTETVPKTVPVTLADMLLVAVVIVATVVTTRTAPGLLEIAILGRLPIDAGVRHAAVIISRYTVTLLGAIIACRMLGMTWSSVQWLAAAMTVGLGFGLQEIFANLVSGLIILFERPIRIGDLVTVAGTTGKVTRMQIRATTITDFDRRELIVPNKKFITEDVVNWTLSDSVSRFVVPVGISYDCNPSRARDLLLQIAAEHPLVLNEPEPSAVFCGFGNSTLDLELRAFIATREHFVTVLNEVNTAIEQRFREANIEIAFPQQDIHIRGISGLGEVTDRDNDQDKTRKAA
jgi:potassium efflux system protein